MSNSEQASTVRWVLVWRILTSQCGVDVQRRLVSVISRLKDWQYHHEDVLMKAGSYVETVTPPQDLAGCHTFILPRIKEYHWGRRGFVKQLYSLYGIYGRGSPPDLLLKQRR
jgi:hypothetical protein